VRRSGPHSCPNRTDQHVSCTIASRFRTRRHPTFIAGSHLAILGSGAESLPVSIDVIVVSRCLMGCCGGLPSSPRTPFGVTNRSSNEITRQSAAERAIRRRNKSRADLEVDTPKMLTAIVWLTLFGNQDRYTSLPRYRPCKCSRSHSQPRRPGPLSQSGRPAVRSVHGAFVGRRSSIHLPRVQSAAGGCRRCGELVAMVALLAAFPAAPVACPILVAISEIEFVRCRLRAW